MVAVNRDKPDLRQKDFAGSFDMSIDWCLGFSPQACQMIRVQPNNDVEIQFLRGYNDSGYLGDKAAEGTDWVWENRSNELGELGCK